MEGNLYSTVKGVEMVIDAEVCKAVAGIDMGGVHKFEELEGNTEEIIRLILER